MLTQHLSGQLLRDQVTPGSADLSAIHALPNPPLVQLSTDDIHVRRCRLASDAIDSRFGRFRKDDMPRLLELIQGAPVLIGHDKRTLGVARFFGGDVEQREGVSWIIPQFYWPRAHSAADDLRVMIDSGVYSEASIAFTYRTPTCSVCGNDIRGCAHWPGRNYEDQLCFFYYDGIERVTEGSLVYRGAAHGTGFELPAHDGENANSAASHSLMSPTVSRLADDISTISPTPDSDDAGPTLTIKHRGRRYLALLRPLKED
ncbi:hypothetical protein BMS3Bbin04_01403 [bacterium BMS3Bbin04]|nr:hypothetical protein BMS3Bbin04_01403 [bacterium BMS3Bbin04]